MQPEVIAWALLFVVSFGIVYRFFSWIGRRLGGKSEAETATQDASVSGADAPTAPDASEPVSYPQPAPPKPTPPPSLAIVDGPRPAPARIYALPGKPVDDASVALAAEPEPPPPVARAFSASEISGVPSAVISARIAAEAVRTALAPSVGATMPPPTPLKPSVAATLPPAPLDTPPVVTEPQDEPEPPTEIAAAAAPAPAQSPSIPEVHDDASPVSEARGARSVRLLARRIGVERISLNIRLRDARERRVRRTPRTVRASSVPGPKRGLRVLVPKKSAAKTAARRIVQKPGDAIALASTQARTKIIGASLRPFRVLLSPDL